MRFLLLGIMFLAPLTAMADEPRHSRLFKSPNGRYELRYVSGQSAQQKWSLRDKVTKDVRYHITAQLSSMTVLVSDDGITLVAVDDYSEREPSTDLEVLLFYREGKLVKKYLLGELLDDVSNISSSVSHFQWLFGREPLSISDSRLNLTTFELVHYAFNTEKGHVLKKEQDSALSDDALYVYGKVTRLGQRRYQMEVCHVVQGGVPAGGKVEFEAERDDLLLTNQYHTVIIKDGRLIAVKDVRLNSCNYRQQNPPVRSESNNSTNRSRNSLSFIRRSKA